MKIHVLAIALLLMSGACAGGTPRDKVIDYMALYAAARTDNEQLAEALLQRGAPVDAPDVNSAGMLSFNASLYDSPLQIAAERGNATIVRLILKHKPWVDHRCCTSPAALGMAVQAGHVEIVEMLLEAGADPSIESEYDDSVGDDGNGMIYRTPLYVAKKKGYTEIARLLEAAKDSMVRYVPHR